MHRKNPSYLKVSLKNDSVDATPFSACAQISLITDVGVTQSCSFNHRSLIRGSSYDQTLRTQTLMQHIVLFWLRFY